jgi:hypothetical protein
MRILLIFLSLFIIRFVFFPFDIEGKLDFLYHAFMGFCVGVLAVFVETLIIKYNKQQ